MEPMTHNEFAVQVEDILHGIGEMLCAKNKAYGNSALNPIRAFAQSDATEQIKVRIDDKISRIMRGHNAGEDTIDDLIGYLVLLKMAETKGE